MNRNARSLALTPTIGFACAARPTFVVDYAQDKAHEALSALRELNWPVVGDTTLIMDVPSATAAARSLRAQNVDLLVVLCGTFSDASPIVELAAQVAAPICLWALREPGTTGERLWLNSLCGAHIATHALKHSGHSVTYIYGDPGEEALLQSLAAHARAVITRKRLRNSRIGLVGQAPMGFYGCQFDELQLKEHIGTSVTQIDLASLFQTATQADPTRVEAMLAATSKRLPGLETLQPAENRRFAQAYVALRDILDGLHLDGLAVRCWPEFPQEFDLMPCATLGRLSDDGFVCACEADMHGAVTMLASQWLSGAAPFLADVVALDEEANTLTLWHCGNAPACLAPDDQPARLTVHCNRRIGVAGNFPIRSGEATLVRLGVGPHGYRLLFVQGAILPTSANRFMGNTAVFQPTGDARRLLDTIILGAWEHHMVLVPAHIAPELAALAHLLEIESVSL